MVRSVEDTIASVHGDIITLGGGGPALWRSEFSILSQGAVQYLTSRSANSPLLFLGTAITDCSLDLFSRIQRLGLSPYWPKSVKKAFVEDPL